MEFEIAINDKDIPESPANRRAPHVQEILKAAQDELRRLVQQRSEITKRIGTIKQTVVGICNLFGDDELSDDLYGLVNGKTVARRSGITQACRKVLMDAGCPLTAKSVCQQIQQRAIPNQLYSKNLVAEVTTVLSRLAQYGEVRTVPCENGSRAWVWVSDVEDGSIRSAVSAADSQA